MSDPKTGCAGHISSMDRVLTVTRDPASGSAFQQTFDEACDGVHPATHQSCTLRRHIGCHQTTDGIHWLDD